MSELKLRPRSEEHTSELQSRLHLVCRLLLEKKNPAARREPLDQTLSQPVGTLLYLARRRHRQRAARPPAQMRVQVPPAQKQQRRMDPQGARRLLQPGFQLIVAPARHLRRGLREALYQEGLEVGLEVQRLERTDEAQPVSVGVARGTEQCQSFAQEHVVQWTRVPGKISPPVGGCRCRVYCTNS